MPSIRMPKKQRFIFDRVTWGRYNRLLRMLSDRHLRITYDRGFLEIMTISFAHDRIARFLGRFVIVLTEEFSLQVVEGGSTTFRKRDQKKGLEPDNCFWIAHEAEVRDKTKIDLRIDPPPDLAIEVDISRSSIDRMHIYASLRIPEVWRHDANGLSFFALNAAGQYDPAPSSTIFAVPITPADIMPFVNLRGTVGNNDILRQFRASIQAKIAAARQP